jgi:hypothetical protein
MKLFKKKEKKNEKGKKFGRRKIKRSKKLLQSTSASKAAVIMGVVSKNAILGALYREKEKNGYVPPADSPYARIRKYRKGF